MKKPYFLVSCLAIVGLVLGFGVSQALAATTDFTADGNITVTGVTFGNSVADLIIFTNSTAESWSFTSGVFTVTNPGSFKVGSSGADVLAFVDTYGTIEVCANNTVPGTTYMTLTAGATHTITPVNHACGGGGGGGAAASAPASGGGAVTGDTGQSSSLGVLGDSGKTASLAVNAQADFTTTVSGGGAAASHSVQITALDTANKKITVVLRSNPVTVNLNLGESKNVDLDGDGVNDVSVKFNGLVNNKADLIITNIVAAGKIGLKLGDKIKVAGNSAVYYIDANGKRHLFSNEVTYWTWYSGAWSAQGVKTISQADFDNITEGAHVTVKPAGKLIKFQNSPRVYVVNKDKSLSKVATSEKDDSVAKKLYGSDYKKKVILIQDSFETDYISGEALTAVSKMPIETKEISDLF